MFFDMTGNPAMLFVAMALLIANCGVFAAQSETESTTVPVTTGESAPREEPIENESDDSPRLIVVTPTRTAHHPDEVSSSVSVMTQKDFTRKHRQNIEDMLRDLEGLDFGRQAGVAHQTYPVIRGVGGTFAGATTQILIDGMAQDAATSNILGHGGLNFMDVQDIERVELVRGPISSLYGYGAIGGVINVIPKRWNDEAGAEIKASHGANDTWLHGGAVGSATDNFDVRVSFYDARSDGFIAKPERDRFGQIDYGPRDWTDHKIGLNGGYMLDSRQEITFSHHEYETDSAINGGDRPYNRQLMSGRSTRLSYQYDLNNGASLKARYQVTRLAQDYWFDEEDWSGDIGNFALAYSGSRISDSKRFLLELDSKLSTAHHLIVGLSHDEGTAETHSASLVRASDDTTDAIYLQDEYSAGAFSLTAGIRYDRIDLSPITNNGAEVNGIGSVDNVVSPRLSALYKLNDATSFYASAGSAFLPAPNNFKFVQPSAIRVDNPDLKPEQSISYEVGMRNSFGWGRLRTAVYRTEYEDKIALGVDSVSGLDQWQNIAVRRVLGLELALEGDLDNGWYPYANYTHLDAEDQAASGAEFTEATRVSPNKFNLGFTYESAQLWSFTFNGRWVDAQYFNNLSEAQKADSYFQADALFRMNTPGFGGKLDLFMACNNITDKKYQPFNIDEWSDGRTFTVGVNGRF